MNRRVAYIAAAALLLLLLPVGYYFFYPSDEARLRSLLRKAELAAEAGDIKGLMSTVSYQYTDERGLSYFMLSRIIEDTLKGLTGVEVDMRGLDLKVEGKKAHATMSLRVSATFPDGQRAYFVGSFSEGAELSLDLVRDKALNWEVLRSRYTPRHEGR